MVMKLSIVIRAYNEDEHIERLLIGLRVQTKVPYEVILVDSGSTDDTVTIARRYGAKVVHIDKEDFTFGRALNRGCEAATGDVFVFPSAHVYPVFNTWLEKLTEPFKDKRVALSYGRQRGGERNKFSEHQIFARWFPVDSVCPQRTYFCNNANCAVRRSVWKTLPYDEALTGLEDLAWAKAIQTRGGWIAYVAEAEIIHVHDETWEQVQNRYRREAIAMKAIDEHAKFSWIDFVCLLPRTVISDLKAALGQGKLRREFVSILKFRYSQLRGTYIGYNGTPELTAELRRRFYYPTSPHDCRVIKRGDASHRIDYDLLESQQNVDLSEIPPMLADRSLPYRRVLPATEENDSSSGAVVRILR